MIEITNKKDCCGCTACQSVCNKEAIVMLPDEEGFLYPHVNKTKCTNCGLCEKVCPIQKRRNTKKEKNYQKLYALRHLDEETLMLSSSGGAFSAIAEYVLSQGGTVVGAIYNCKMQVVHSFAKTYDEFVKVREIGRAS